MNRFNTNPHRGYLLGGLRAGLESLRSAACSTVWIDGSFITSKDLPGNIDVLYDNTGLDWDELERIAGRLERAALVIQQVEPSE